MKNKKRGNYAPNTHAAKDTKEKYTQRVFNILHKNAMSRRMAITKAGYPDQTYLITQSVYDWIEEGKACVIGKIRCSRSGRNVECITTDPNLFINPKNDK